MLPGKIVIMKEEKIHRQPESRILQAKSNGNALPVRDNRVIQGVIIGYVGPIADGAPILQGLNAAQIQEVRRLHSHARRYSPATALSKVAGMGTDDVVSECGEDSAEELFEHFDTASGGMKRGPKLQDCRFDALKGFGHLNSSLALRSDMEISMGGRAAALGCGVLAYPPPFARPQPPPPPPMYFTMSSSAPMSKYVQEEHGYDVGESTRAMFGDGSHVHTEMNALHSQLKAGVTSGFRIIVSKQTCPVCRSVLNAFGVTVLDDEGVGLYSPRWTNPFVFDGPLTPALKSFSDRIDAAARPHGGNCNLRLNS